MSWSRLTAFVLATALGCIPLAPSEHVHEETDEAGHHTLIVHRHAQLHGLDAIASVEHGLVDVFAVAQRAKVDHADPVTLFPDDTYTAPPLYVLQPPVLPATFVLAPPEPTLVSRQARWSDQLIHAPPRAPASPRAPPASPFL